MAVALGFDAPRAFTLSPCAPAATRTSACNSSGGFCGCIGVCKAERRRNVAGTTAIRLCVPCGCRNPNRSRPRGATHQPDSNRIRQSQPDDGGGSRRRTAANGSSHEADGQMGLFQTAPPASENGVVASRQQRTRQPVAPTSASTEFDFGSFFGGLIGEAIPSSDVSVSPPWGLAPAIVRGALIPYLRAATRGAAPLQDAGGVA